MRPEQRAITWTATGDAEHPYEARVDSHRWRVRLGDFPAEPLYTLLIDGFEVVRLDTWPATWTKPAPPPVTRYYAVNDRPVKFVPTPDGGLDILALNMRTGEFERAMQYLSKVSDPFADVDELDEADFEARVAEIRAGLA